MFPVHMFPVSFFIFFSIPTLPTYMHVLDFQHEGTQGLRVASSHEFFLLSWWLLLRAHASSICICPRQPLAPWVHPLMPGVVVYSPRYPPPPRRSTVDQVV